jgi:hypothetical protein
MNTKKRLIRVTSAERQLTNLREMERAGELAAISQYDAALQWEALCARFK